MKTPSENPQAPVLVFRADGDAAMGTGHLMRCLSLACAWREEGGRAVFLCADIPEAVANRMSRYNIPVHVVCARRGTMEDASATLALAGEFGNGWLVVDGYHFDGTYQDRLSSEGPVLFLDDYGHADHYSAQLVLNQNLYASEGFYPRTNSGSRLLLGPSYALLRREFRDAGPVPLDVRVRADRVLVSLGGSDPHNATGTILEALESVEPVGLEVKVVLGGANPRGSEIRHRAGNSRHRVEVLEDVTDMVALLKWADVAVCAGGTTALEILRLGVPCAMVEMADNQTRVVESFAGQGLAVPLGREPGLDAALASARLSELIADASKRGAMRRAASSLVDGLGCFRVLNEMGLLRFHFRDAVSSDAEMLLQWANDPDVRLASFNSAMIKLEEHKAWLNARLSDADSRIWIAQDWTGRPVGVARFAMEGDTATISVSVDRAVRQRKYGSPLIRSASYRILGAGAKRVRAMIRPENKASIRAFESAGYKHTGTTSVSGQDALSYEFF